MTTLKTDPRVCGAPLELPVKRTKNGRQVDGIKVRCNRPHYHLPDDRRHRKVTGAGVILHEWLEP